jgi:hypothetical protein
MDYYKPYLRLILMIFNVLFLVARRTLVSSFRVLVEYFGSLILESPITMIKLLISTLQASVISPPICLVMLLFLNVWIWQLNL